MRVAINLVKDEVAQACVSAGNTGALMAISRFVLKTLPGIDRPAIAGQLPTRDGVVTVLDLGANVNCSPEQLMQFAVMGSALVTAMDGIERPTVGLLNVGEEEIKGNDLAKQTAELLRASGLNFYGNVEGDDIYKGTTEVIVCDGFVGNVALKASEGLAVMLYAMLKERIHAQRADAAGGADRVPGVARLQAPRRSAPVQRRDADRLEGRRRQEPRLRRCARVPVRAAQGVHGSRPRRPRQDRAAHGDDGRVDGRRPRWPKRRWAMYSRIVGTGSYLPAQILTNDDLAKRVDTSDEWIRARTGIRERRLAAPSEKTSDLAEQAARTALAAAGIAPADVDLIVVATTTPDMVFPSTACIVQAKLGAAGGPAFDVQAVCSGFVYALAVADRMVASGMARNALVVGAEIYSRILDWSDRGSCVLFGDGAGAVVLVPSEVPGIGSAHLHADGRYRDILCVPGTVSEGAISGTPYVRMDGPAVFKFAVQGHGRGRRRSARGQRRRRVGLSIGSFPTRPTSGSWKRPRKSWEFRPSG